MRTIYEDQVFFIMLMIADHRSPTCHFKYSETWNESHPFGKSRTKSHC